MPWNLLELKVGTVRVCWLDCDGEIFKFQFHNNVTFLSTIPGITYIQGHIDWVIIFVLPVPLTIDD